jgi:DNA repair protein RadC
MSAELFNESEQELLDAARIVLSDGINRLRDRKALFVTNRNNTREQRAEVAASRKGLQDYLQVTYGPLRHEIAVAALIDAQGRLIGVHEFPKGALTHCPITCRHMAEMVVRAGAAAVILSHNHPSGESTPSQADIDLTVHMRGWLDAMECRLLDHLIVTVSEVVSIAGECGL